VLVNLKFSFVPKQHNAGPKSPKEKKRKKKEASKEHVHRGERSEEGRPRLVFATPKKKTWKGTGTNFPTNKQNKKKTLRLKKKNNHKSSAFELRLLRLIDLLAQGPHLELPPRQLADLLQKLGELHSLFRLRIKRA